LRLLGCEVPMADTRQPGPQRPSW